jgi:glutamate racemase
LQIEAMTHSSNAIGVFDSGIGGLSILKALIAHLPQERFVYFADTAHSPYGEKSEAFVQQRTLAVARELVTQHQIKAMVVACNTATAAAIALLRAAYPDLPIVGVEPALRPAALASTTGRIKVLATRGTLQSAKFAQLQKKLEEEYVAAGKVLQFDAVACDGLAERIEQMAAANQATLNTTDLIALRAGSMPAIDQFISKNAPFDTLVLGCTHYPLIRDAFAALAGEGVQIVDNALPVALRTAQLLIGFEAPVNQTGGVVWRSSGDETKLVQAAQYWGVA